jgi:large subunit ribosomal protein L17
MRHGISGNKFGRNQTLRKATVRDLCRAVLKFEAIKTTRAKAVEARKAVDRLITLGKKNTLAAKRRAFSILIDHDLVSSLFNVVAPRFVNRQGGYTRIIKFAVNRPGDNAEMVLLELTERSVAVTPKDQVSDAVVVESKGDAKGEGKASARKAKPSDAEKKEAKPAAEKAPVKKAPAKKAASKE